MKRKFLPVLALALLALLLALPARSEEGAEGVLNALDLASLQRVAAEGGSNLDVRALIAGLVSGEAGVDPEKIQAQAAELFQNAWRDMLAALPGLLLPALVAVLTRRLIRDGKGVGVAQYVCGLACALAGIALLAELLEEARVVMGRMSALGEAVFPLLSGMLAASGARASSALLTPMAAVLDKLLVSALGGVGLRLCAVALAVAVAGNLHPRLTLKNLFSLIDTAVGWFSGIVMTGFVGVLSVQGLLGAGRDSASVRAARYAADNLLPVIGGEVADAMGALASSVRLVRSATGAAGLLLLGNLCVRPLIRMAAGFFCMKLASAIMEPLSEEGLTRMAEQFAKVAQMLLVLTAACMVLLVLLLGAMLAAGRGLAW